MLFAACTADQPIDGNGKPHSPPVADRGQPRRFKLPFDCSGKDNTFEPIPEPRIAVDSGKRIRVITTEGRTVARLRAEPPVGWSPTGFLATGPKGLLWGGGESPYERGEQQVALSKEDATWAWSPVADCAATLTSGHLRLFRLGIPPTATPIIEDGVESFSFSPDGKQIALVVNRDGTRSLEMANLVTHRINAVKIFDEGTCCVALGGWTADSTAALYWAGPGVSVMADGWPLESVSAESEVSKWGRTLPQPNVLERCGTDLVALVGGDRFQQGNRVARLRAGGATTPLTPTGHYSAVTCSEDGGYFVTTGEDGIRLYRGDGTSMYELAPDPSDTNDPFTNLVPEWGPPHSGVLVERQSHNYRQLWFIPEGGTARVLIQLSLNTKVPLTDLFDWSATPPQGLSTLR